MVLVTRISGADYLCDVGFGGDGPLQPVPMSSAESLQGHDTFRVVAEESIDVLQLKRGNEWTDLYAVDREEAYPVDFELGNWFTSTHPQSPFVKHVIVQQRTAEARHMLRDLVYVEYSDGVNKERTIERRELVPLLREVFEIYLDPDVTLRALDAPKRIAKR
jgi:N-hydroxyarylamine O-acetyltransferase